MPFYIYRKNGGEVFGVTVTEPVKLDPLCSYLEDATKYDLSLGYIYDAGEIRLATEQEKTDFETAQKEDLCGNQKDDAKTPFSGDVLDCPNPYRRSMRAMYDVVMAEINILRNLAGVKEWTDAEIKTKIDTAIDNATD